MVYTETRPRHGFETGSDDYDSDDQHGRSEVAGYHERYATEEETWRNVENVFIISH